VSFARYIAGDIVIFLLAVVTLPLWLPFWLWISFRNWLDLQRFWWECDQAAQQQRQKQDAFCETNCCAPVHHKDCPRADEGGAA
jgi:hypothetical protein